MWGDALGILEVKVKAANLRGMGPTEWEEVPPATQRKLTQQTFAGCQSVVFPPDDDDFGDGVDLVLPPDMKPLLHEAPLPERDGGGTGSSVVV